MATPHLVYVHGAGRQEHRELLKRRLDEHLFGANQLDRTTVGYYSDLLHDEPALPEALAAAGAEAADIEAVFIARASTVAAIEAQTAVAMGGEPGPGDDRPAPLAGFGFPDPAFLLLATLASTDVTAYLFGSRRDDIQERVRTAITRHAPCIVLAHSMGTIVTYDVLAGLPAGTVPVLITAGSPLGLQNVQRRIGDRTGPPAAFPPAVGAWYNFADPFDPVAFEGTLADEFVPPGRITDRALENRALLNHDLTGYLDTAEVRATVKAAIEVITQGTPGGGG